MSKPKKPLPKSFMKYLTFEPRRGERRPLNIEPSLFVDDPEAAVTDLLADLRHYCAHRKLDFYECLRVAENHFREEAK